MDIRLTIRAPSTAFAYLDFKSDDAAQRALAANGTLVGGTAISVAISDPKKKKQAKADPKCLIATNLPFSYTEPDVKLLFAPVSYRIAC
jgi:hypothetical protein